MSKRKKVQGKLVVEVEWNEDIAQWEVGSNQDFGSYSGASWIEAYQVALAYVEEDEKYGPPGDISLILPPEIAGYLASITKIRTTEGKEVPA